MQAIQDTANMIVPKDQGFVSKQTTEPKEKDDEQTIEQTQAKDLHSSTEQKKPPKEENTFYQSLKDFSTNPCVKSVVSILSNLAVAGQW